jgi:predicted dithiol-disulfide oxidoreductase (DUF899 family)
VRDIFITRIKRKGEATMATQVTGKTGNPRVTSQAQWLAARKQLLTEEKEFTKLRDEVSRQRRELPWERVEKKYVFDAAGAKKRWPICLTGAAS